MSQRPIPGIRPLSRRWSGPLRDSLFGLAPDGVFRAVLLALHAVRSYRTFSPSPAGACAQAGCLFSVALSVEKPRGFPPACIPVVQTWVTWRRALWSSDFPPPACARSDSPPFQNHHKYNAFQKNFNHAQTAMEFGWNRLPACPVWRPRQTE